MKWFGKIGIVAAILGAAVLLTRALYSTETGGRIQRFIPEAAWNAIYATLGLHGAETTGNADLAVWFAACFALCAAIFLGSRMLFRRFVRRD
jgi:hypothetical protein